MQLLKLITIYNQQFDIILKNSSTLPKIKKIK